MTYLKLKQKAELHILQLNAKRNHFIIDTSNSLNKKYYLIKLVAPQFFEKLLTSNAKYPLYISAFKTKKDLLSNKLIKTSRILILDNYLIKKEQIPIFWSAEENITCFLFNATSETKP